MEEQNEIIKRINKLETQVSINKRIDLLDNAYQKYNHSFNKSKMSFILILSVILILLSVTYYEYFVMKFDVILPVLILVLPLSTLSLGLMNHMNHLSLLMKQYDKQIALLKIQRSFEQ